MTVTKEQFLQAVFGERYKEAFTVSFTEDPSSSAARWGGRAYGDGPLAPGNIFYCVSLFDAEDGRANRRAENFAGMYVVAIDDCAEKIPLDKLMALPPPSIKVQSSLHSEQWLWLLTEPETCTGRIDALQTGLIELLTEDGKDTGFRSVSRLLRLPSNDGSSVNTKPKRVIENRGTPPQVEVTEWHPERRYSLEQIAVPLSIDLNVVVAGNHSATAEDLVDHPLLHTPALTILKRLGKGRHSVVCPWKDEHGSTGETGAAVFVNSDSSIGMKCHHAACIDSRTGKDLLDHIENKDSGFKDRLKHYQTQHAFSEVSPGTAGAAPPPLPVTAGVAPPPPISPLSILLSNSANGDSQKMKAKMLDDRFVLKDLAILGQFTVLYAGPNTGKTLLTQWLLREAVATGGIDGGKLFYANCDDTYKGGIEKLELAEEFGYQMLLPNANDFKPDTLVATMKALAESGEATGVVIVLDTLKKFCADLMDKRTSSDFGKVAREFVSAGGSLICLAHTNKHKGADGKSIHTGVADIKDDSDCVYMIEQLGSNKSFGGSETVTVEFECTKSRGDVVPVQSFQYTKQKGAGYRALFDSVKRLGAGEADMAKQEATAAEQRQADAQAIEAIKTAIDNGQSTKTAIVSFVTSTPTLDVSRRVTLSVLEKHEGQLWKVESGLNNAKCYKLVAPPIPPVVSFL